VPRSQKTEVRNTRKSVSCMNTVYGAKFGCSSVAPFFLGGRRADGTFPNACLNGSGGTVVGALSQTKASRKQSQEKIESPS
jgi:hypothetical protein